MSAMEDVSKLPLPPGWECAKTPDGKTYYKNHHLRTTQWHHPLQVRESVPRPPAAVVSSSQLANNNNAAAAAASAPPPRPLKSVIPIPGIAGGIGIGGMTNMFTGLLAKKEAAPKFEIGAPTNFQHITHVK
jgi:hypothetical protein